MTVTLERGLGHVSLRSPRIVAGLRITEMAAELGVTPRALRYYEQIGLISPDRTETGTRVYGGEVRRKLELLTLLRSVGVAVRDISRLQTMEATEARAFVRSRLEARLKDIDGQRRIVAEALQWYGQD